MPLIQSNLHLVMVDRFKVLSINVRGLQCAAKRRDVFYFLRKLDADIYILQETHSDINCEKIWSAEWGSGIFFAHANSYSAGVMIMFKKQRIT